MRDSVHHQRQIDREAAIALRAIERGARSLAKAGVPTAYLTLMGRLLQVNHAADGEDAGPESAKPRPSSIIIP